MKKKPSKATAHPLDQFSHHVSGAIKSFLELLKDWRGGPGTLVSATFDPTLKIKPAALKPGKGLHQPPGQFPWHDILKVARKLLAKDPARVWKIGGQPPRWG